MDQYRVVIITYKVKVIAKLYERTGIAEIVTIEREFASLDEGKWK